QSWGRDRELSVLRSAARAQHECGAARPRCKEACAGQTRGRGDAGASAAGTITQLNRAPSPRKQGVGAPRGGHKIKHPGHIPPVVGVSFLNETLNLVLSRVFLVLQ